MAPCYLILLTQVFVALCQWLTKRMACHFHLVTCPVVSCWEWSLVMSSVRHLETVPAGAFRGRYRTQLTSDLLGKLPLKGAPCPFPWHICDFTAGAGSSRGMTVWVLLFTSLYAGCSSLSWTEIICMQYQGNQTALTTPLLLSPQGAQLLSSSRLANSQTPTQPATQDPERSIFCLPIAFHNKLGLCLVLSQAPFSEKQTPLPPVSLVAHEVGSSSAPAGDRAATSCPWDLQCAVCIRWWWWQAPSPILLSSFKKQVSGLQIHTFFSDLLHY